MYRFALRPWWVVSHVLVLGLIVAMVSLGLWQLDRLDERRDRNGRVEAALGLDPTPVGELVDADAGSVEFRRVELMGGSFGDEAILIDNRSMGGAAGAWVLRPYVLDDGGAVVVNLGFAPYAEGLAVAVPDEPYGPGVAPSEAIAVREASRSCAAMPADQPAVAARLGCVDLEAIEGAVELDLAPVEVRVVSLSAAASVAPGDPQLAPLPLPETDEGPHLSYAVQWFIFTTIAVVGYPLVLRKVARSHAE